jgi:HK97 family phage major capsid protein
MTTAAAASAETTATAPQVIAVRDNGADYINQERARVREISAIGKQLGLSELAERAIDAGTPLDAFRAEAIKEGIKTGAMRTAETPEIGMSSKELEQFSICRALLAAADPLKAREIAPFEFECSRAAQDKRGGSEGTRSKDAAVTIPQDVLSRGLQVHPSAAAAAARMFVQRAQRGGSEAMAMMRDLVVGTNTAGGNTVATELLGSSFIELLRNAMVIDRMGVTMLTGLNGNLVIPTATGTATTYWVAESGAPTESQASFGQVSMTPKTIGAFTDYSRRLLLQSSIDVEMFVRMDLAATLAQGIQDGAINGTGSSNQPTGLLNTVGVGAVAMGTNGGALTYDMFVDLETAVANANADVGNLGYLVNSKVRGKARKTQEFSGTNGKPVWTGAVGSNGVGDVLGYNAYVSNTVPSNLTKGSSNGICSAVAFGNWADLIIGMWGGLDLLLDPYTGATSGTRRVVALQDLDVAVRRVSSFAVSKDVLTT